MRKGREVLGKPVVSYETGEKFDRVIDLIFDQDSNQVVGLLLSEPGFLKSAKILLIEKIHSIGPDAVVVDSAASVDKATNVPSVAKILRRNNILRGTRIMTVNGRDLGTIVDLYFDDEKGVVEGYEVSGGLFADAYSGRSFVPAPSTLKIGEDFAFVPAQTADMMEEQVGGIKGAVQSAGDRVQETAQTTGAKIQETAQTTGAKIQEFGQDTSDRIQLAAATAGDRLQDFGDAASEQAQIAAGQAKIAAAEANIRIRNAAAAAGDKIQELGDAATDQAQIAAGKAQVAAAEANLKARSAASATGDKLQALGNKASDHFNNAVAGVGVESALGRRVQSFIRNDSGMIIAAPGQIVTQIVVERAKANRREQALLSAVGLSTDSAVRDQTQQYVDYAGTRLQSGAESLKAGAQSTGDQIQSGAQSLWEQLKSTANDLQERSTHAVTEQRIKGALGRPVTRVILDQQDGVILNVGDLITHQAVKSARQADMLDALLSSVYVETPKLSLESLRAPHEGKAALK